ncbi:MAG TPA: 4-(cytidine 5'-diphospho)-2-C-methyl-D-erythritol kinase [Streptosporangiaceae bacterium]
MTSVASVPSAVTVRVPAKVNLQLAVGPVRPDGYHGVVTVYQAVSLYDEVSVALAERSRIVVSGEDEAAVPTGPTNLASKAVTALARATGQRRQDRHPVLIEIRKRIPMAAGLAGGSADAAATLAACNELWKTGLTQQELCEVGAGLGSDVPFALMGGTAVGRGRGEQLTVALVSGGYHWVLAFAVSGLSTPEVYATCDRLRAARGDAVAEPELSGPLMSALRSGDAAAVGPLLSNDLQAAAVSLRPELRRALTAGRDLGAVGAMVSGSGPTCMFLAGSAAQASDLAVSLTGAGVCRAVALASGPAPGAAVVPVREPA